MIGKETNAGLLSKLAKPGENDQNKRPSITPLASGGGTLPLIEEGKEFDGAQAINEISASHESGGMVESYAENASKRPC